MINEMTIEVMQPEKKIEIKNIEIIIIILLLPTHTKKRHFYLKERKFEALFFT